MFVNKLGKQLINYLEGDQKKKKITSLILVVAMILSYNIITYAEIPNNNMNNIRSVYKNENKNDIIQLDEINGALYYFRDNEKYTVTATQDLNANIEIAYNNKITNVVSVYNLGKAENKLTTTKEFNRITEVDRLNGYQEKQKINLVVTPKYQISSSNSGVADKIHKKLESIYGSTYSDATIGVMSSNGYTGYLYETKSFDMYKDFNYFLDAGTSLGVLAAIFGFPEVLLLQVFTLISTGTGILSLAHDFTSSLLCCKCALV